MPNYNPASRLHALLSEFGAEPHNQPALQAWLNVFLIHEKDSTRQWILVTHKLRLLLEELDLLERKLPNTVLSRQAYGRQLSEFHQAIDPAGLAKDRHAYTHLLSEDSLSILYACRDALPSDGQPLDPTDIGNLKAKLNELRQTVTESDMPDELKQFFFQHCQILDEALSDYLIRGPAAFVAAHVTTIQLIAVNHDLIERDKDNTEVRAASKRLADVWQWIEDRVDDLETSKKALAYVAGAAAGVQNAAPHLLPIISNIANQLK